MSGRRPLLKSRVDQLEGLFTEKRNDARTLRRLAAELLHRESPRANNLLIKVRARLEEAETDLRTLETWDSKAPEDYERLADAQVPREPPPCAGSAPVELKPHTSILDVASTKELRAFSTTDVFGVEGPVDEVEERDGLYPSSADGSNKRLPFPAKTRPNPSRLTASQAAQWLHDIGELFGTSDLNLHTVAIFLRAAHADRLGQPLESWELARVTGKSTTTISRNVGLLGDWCRQNRPGMGLITAQPDTVDRRRKPIRLTPKGRQLLRMIEDL